METLSRADVPPSRFLGPRAAEWSLAAVAAFTPLLLSFQGLDFTDLGFSLVSYQQAFNDPASCGYAAVFWLSNMLGGMWLALFDGLGVWGVKLAGALALNLTIFLSYLTLRDSFPRLPLLLGLATTTLVSLRFINWLHYNTLSALFYVAAAYLLARGLIRGRPRLVTAGATLLGLSTFVRLPNILGVALVLAPFLWDAPARTLGRRAQSAARFLLAFGGGLLLGFIGLALSGQLRLYRQALSQLFTRQHSAAPLTPSAFFDTLAHNYERVLVCLAVAALLALLLIAVGSVARGRFARCAIPPALCVLALSLAKPWESYARLRDALIDLNSVVVGVCLVVCGLVVAGRIGTGRELRLKALLAGIILVVTPIGSSAGLWNAIYGLALALPLTLCSLLTLRLEGGAWARRVLAGGLPLLRSSALSLLLVFALVIDYRYTYRDSLERSALRHSIAHPLLRLTFTTRERAHWTQELLQKLAPHVERDDVLLIYPNGALLHYLTRTRPFLSNPWPRLYHRVYGRRGLEERVALAERASPCLPVVVSERYWLDRFVWEPMERSNAERVELKRILRRFLRRNGYHREWQGEVFELYLPPRERVCGAAMSNHLCPRQSLRNEKNGERQQ